MSYVTHIIGTRVIEVRDGYESPVEGVKKHIGLRIAHVVAEVETLIEQERAIAIRFLEQLQINEDIVHRRLMQHAVHTKGGHAPPLDGQLALPELTVRQVIAAAGHIVQLEVSATHDLRHGLANN